MNHKIECVSCLSPDCRGCNIYTLSCALKLGKLDWAMDENHAIRTERLTRPKEDET